MAALNRATKANYVIHDRVEAETTDREDHTFCGIMFPVKCKETLPIDHVAISSVAVRGALGPLTVWITNEPVHGEISMSKKHWTRIYQKTHPPSFHEYKELEFSSPILMRPGEVRGVYVHSTLPGDEAIVYDNKEKRKTHDDSFITILPGRAHVSEKAFGSIPIWGWGSAWRDNREFVGQIKYGACYRLWNPCENPSFGPRFRAAARVLFLCQRRPESPFARLPDDCLYYILNMMRWDWVDDTSRGMRREQRELRRRRIAALEARMMAEDEDMEDADYVGDEDEHGMGDEGLAAEEDVELGVEEDAEAAEYEEEDAILGGENDAREGAYEQDADAIWGQSDEEEREEDGLNENMNEDSSDDSEDAESSDDDSEEDSAASEEYAWGDHVGSRSQFFYDDHESSSGDDGGNDDDDDDDDGNNSYEERAAQPRRRSAYVRARRSILSFLNSH